MNQLSIIDALDIMNSDMKLWDHADKEQTKGGLRLTLNLPWDIEETTVTLEGLGDAEARRHAVGAYGDYIRGLIKERIDDTAITARAKLASAGREQEDSDSRAGTGGGARERESSIQEATLPETIQTRRPNAEKAVGLGETLIARRVEIEDRIEYERISISLANKELNNLHRELRGIVAALEAMKYDDAPTNSSPESEGSPREEGEEPST